MTNQGGKIVWRATHDPFGQAKVLEDVDGDGQKVSLNLRFPGQYYDAESGLHYNYYRTYDTQTGRYINSDPIGLRGGLNTYSYAEANPVITIDPFGLVKLYGNYCGPNWTGGFRKSYDELDSAERSAALSPIDDLDQCCQTHDITYADCRTKYPCDKKARQQCFQKADRSLSSCAAGTTGNSPRQLILMIGDPANGGNPNQSIEDYMRDSEPASEDNAENCLCKDI